MRQVKVVFENPEGEENEILVESNNLPMGIAKARQQLTLKRIREEGWKYRRADFVRGINQETSISEIHSRVMSGRSVSGHDLARYIRSPKGMLTVAMFARA